MLDLLQHIVGRLLWAPIGRLLSDAESRHQIRRELAQMGSVNVDAVVLVLLHFDPLRLNGSADEEAIYQELACRANSSLRGDWSDALASVATLRRSAKDISSDVMLTTSRRRLWAVAGELSSSARTASSLPV